MNPAERKNWAQRAIQVINAIFPSSEPAPWTRSQRYIIDALQCLEEVSRLQLATAEIQELRFKSALYLHDRGQYIEAETHYQQVLTSRKLLLGVEHPETLRTQHDLANLYKEHRPCQKWYFISANAPET